MRRMIAGLLILMLSACATPEYYAEEDICETEWYARIPEDPQQRWVTRYRSEKRFTGTVTCTEFNNQTRCEHERETVQVPYQAIQNYDANAARRAPHIRQCTVDRCLRLYGNAACEI